MSAPVRFATVKLTELFNSMFLVNHLSVKVCILEGIVKDMP